MPVGEHDDATSTSALIPPQSLPCCYHGIPTAFRHCKTQRPAFLILFLSPLPHPLIQVSHRSFNGGTPSGPWGATVPCGRGHVHPNRMVSGGTFTSSSLSSLSFPLFSLHQARLAFLPSACFLLLLSSFPLPLPLHSVVSVRNARGPSLRKRPRFSFLPTPATGASATLVSPSIYAHTKVAPLPSQPQGRE